MDVPSRKRELRSLLAVRRHAIVDRPARSAQLWAAVEARAEWQAARTVMVYLSFGSEPDTALLTARARADGKTVLVPRVEGDALVAVPADGPTIRSPIGVDEPQGQPVDPAAIDLVVVPGLAFTVHGDRLGFGRGYYDRFLPTLAPTAVTLGACFRELLVEDLPVAPHDVRVHIVVAA
jgi:5-formyltetrahydrofolate cyclo-ligase